MTLFFRGKNGHICSTEEFAGVLKRSISTSSDLANLLNYIVGFIDWVINQHSCEPSEGSDSLPAFNNPLTRLKIQGSMYETVRNPLPYRYIESIRQILCPVSKGRFRDWTWAQQQTGQVGRGIDGDWFEVKPGIIDKDDPDCVWRTKQISQANKKVTIYQIWSPVKAMVIFIKLNLPLRTYQVRMLDSGEADTWRYWKGEWKPNKTNSFALGSEKRPFAKGVLKGCMTASQDSSLQGYI